jgi:hypothetical protein
VLNLPVTGLALPAQTTCPLCGEAKLHIFQDNITTGQWYACSNCGSRGDMIELASAVWGLSAGATLQKLVKLGVELDNDCLNTESVNAYVKDQQHYRRRLLDMWQDAKDYLPRNASDNLRYLQRVYRLKLHGDNARWLEGPGRLFGALPVGEIEACLQPGTMNLNGKRSRHLLFKGRGWDDVFVLPFFDMPDRIKSLMMLGRRGDPVKDQVFKSTVFKSTLGNEREAGLACVEAVPLSGDGRQVIATDDWILALQIQCRTFHSDTNPLPLVVWHDDGKYVTKDAWQMLSSKEIVFWAMDMDPRVVSQAVRVDGLLSTAGPRDYEDMPHYLRLNPGRQLPRVITNRALPWPKALARWMRKHSDSEVEELILGLEQRGEDVSYILRQCGKASRAIPVVRKSRQQIQLGQHTVIESGDTWRVAGKRRSLIADATLRISSVIRNQDNNESYYKGSIGRNGKQVPFVELASVVENDTFGWMRRLLLEQDLGVLICDPDWNRKMVAVATLFRVPATARVSSRLGWNEHEGCFNFQKYKIHPGGRVTPNENALPSPSAPGHDALSPVELDKVLLPRGDKAGLTGLLAALVASNVVAPAVGHRPLGIALLGPDARRVLSGLLKPLGCPQAVLTRQNASQLIEQEKQHGWPLNVLTAAGLSRRFLAAWCGEEGVRNVCAPLNEVHAASLIAGGHWLGVYCPEDYKNSQPGAAAVELVPALVLAASSRLDELARSKDLPQSIMELLIEMVKQRAPDTVADYVNAATWLRTPQRHGRQMLMSLILHLLYSGAMKTEGRETTPGKVTFDGENFTISHDALREACDAAYAPTPDFEAVLAVMKQQHGDTFTVSNTELALARAVSCCVLRDKAP